MFSGSYVAIITPFKNGKIDKDAFKNLVEFQAANGTAGIVPCGTTGEFSSLTMEEKKQVISIALDEVAGRVPVLAGTGCPSTRETLELTRWAKEAGAAAALVVAPYYLKPAYNEVYDHYKALDSVGLPLVLYNIPQTAGTHYEWWTAEGMALDFDNVVGIKDSSGDMPFLMALFEKIGGKVGIFCGHDEIAGTAFLAGADGAILATANIIPDIWQEIYGAALRGDVEAVRRRHKEIQILVRTITRKGAIQGVKECMRMLGLQMSDSRRPNMQGDAFEREDYEDVRTQLENLGKIPVATRTFAGTDVQMAATPETPKEIGDLTLCVGEGFAGPPFSELAHIDLLIGWKDGPVGKAIQRAMGEPRPGHEPSIIADRPQTMLVPTVTVRGPKAKQLVYVEAATGVKRALEHAIARGTLPEEMLDRVCLIANVFVHPAASIARRVQINNYKAMRGAIRKAIERRPTLAELLNERESARHPFRYAP